MKSTQLFLLLLFSLPINLFYAIDITECDPRDVVSQSLSAQISPIVVDELDIKDPTAICGYQFGKLRAVKHVVLPSGMMQFKISNTNGSAHFYISRNGISIRCGFSNTRSANVIYSSSSSSYKFFTVSPTQLLIAPFFDLRNFTINSSTGRVEFDIVFLQAADCNSCLYSSYAALSFNSSNASTKSTNLSKSLNLTASPTVFTTALNVQYHLDEDEPVLQMTLYDATGKAVKAIKEAPQNAGYQQITIEAADLLRGLYFIEVRTPTYQQTLKVIKFE